MLSRLLFLALLSSCLISVEPASQACVGSQCPASDDESMLLQASSAELQETLNEEDLSDEATVDEASNSTETRRRKPAPAPAPAPKPDTSKLENKVKELEERIIELEGEVDDLQSGSKGGGGKPSPPPPPPSPPGGGGGGGKKKKKDSSPSPSPPSGGGGGAGGTPGETPTTDIDRWVNAHNYWRCIHNAPPAHWDEGLAQGAQKWVDDGNTGHAAVYKLKPPLGPCGENIAGGSHLTIEQAADMWHDESPERGPNCGGHCTAMLWNEGIRLGCGLAKGGMGVAMVCRYGSVDGPTPNFGSKQGHVNFPDNSREPQCKEEYPQGEGASEAGLGGSSGGGGSGGGGGMFGGGGGGGHFGGGGGGMFGGGGWR